LNYLNIPISKLFLICVFFIPVIPVYAVDDSLEEYFSSIRPGPKDKPTEIKVGLAVLNIDSIDGANQSFIANIFIAMQWEDPRLATERRSRRRLSVDEVWNPSIQILN